VQLTLPFARRDREALDEALDQVREKFGTSAVTRAVLLGRDPGISMPTLPDEPLSPRQEAAARAEPMSDDPEHGHMWVEPI